MRKLLPVRERSEFQPRVRYHLLSHAMKSASVPARWIIPRIDLPLFGMASIALLIIALVIWIALWVVSQLRGGGSPSPALSIIKIINTILFWVTLVSLVFAGDNGRRFAGWLGLRSFSRRKAGVVADQAPKSREVVRVGFEALFAYELAILIWWLVMQLNQPIPAEMFSDPLLYLEAKEAHFATQLALYWWLPLILGPIIAGVLNWLERKPLVGFVLLKTRLIIPIVPLVGWAEAKLIFGWVEEMTGFSIRLSELIKLITG